ncbi:MAG: HAD hydrolase-like protein [Actinomycetales bacterium]|nr:HAD hydrolase-like protein [Actinomycetales bacterium]
MHRPDVVLLDLDGTITDSIPGILRCLRLALPILELDHISNDELQTWLGPPLRVTVLERYGRTETELDAFVQEYRTHYFGGGEYEFEVFPGMADLVADIGSSEVPLVLATAKPIESAERVLTRAGLIEHFDFVSGTELDLARQDKPAVIAYGLSSIGRSIDQIDAVVVGDRKEDVLGARHHGLRAVGVAWGYAVPGELEAVGPDRIVTTADELRSALGF